MNFEPCACQYDEALSLHRIDRVEFVHFRQVYPRLLGKNAIKSYHGFGGTIEAVRLFTDQGASGWGTLSRPPKMAMEAAEQLIGKKLTEVFSAGTGILDGVYAPFDLALHDLAGRILGIPVARMLNPEAGRYARAYDGAIYMNDIIPEQAPWGIQRVLDDCAYDIALGHTALKIKIGRGKTWMDHDAGLQRDIELVCRIHETFPSAELLVDANDGYSVEDAIDFLEGVKNVPIYWFEEPMRENEADLTVLKDYIAKHRPRTMIADGESRTHMPTLFDLSAKGLIDVIQPDLYYLGFTEWRKLLNWAAQEGKLASPHAWDCILKTYYCAHLEAAFPFTVPTIETVIGRCEGIDESGYKLENGVFRIPDAPGFGLNIDYAASIDESLGAYWPNN